MTQVPVYNAAEIFTGEAASIIRLKDGTTWGAGNQYGQLGIGHKNPIATLTRVPFLDDAKQIAILYDEVIALKADGSVWGAGRNLFKILAQGDAELRATFVKIPVSNVKQMSGCAGHIIVQKNNGEVWGWGHNFIGQLGLGDKLDREMPVLLPTPPAGVKKIFTSGATTFLIDNNGKVWATGGNGHGQLATGDFNSRSSFTPITFFDNKSVDFIIPRTGATGFKEPNGNTWNVGDNVRGLMGIGSISLPYTSPVQMPGFQSTMIGGIGQTAYALKPDGTLWAWGANSYGALGVGKDTTDISSPIQLK
ncbi:MAG TPA: hypothetical protein VFZ47_04175, partial [Chitinophagaceae bacterium]